MVYPAGCTRAGYTRYPSTRTSSTWYLVYFRLAPDGVFSLRLTKLVRGRGVAESEDQCTPVRGRGAAESEVRCTPLTSD